MAGGATPGDASDEAALFARLEADLTAQVDDAPMVQRLPAPSGEDVGAAFEPSPTDEDADGRSRAVDPSQDRTSLQSRFRGQRADLLPAWAKDRSTVAGAVRWTAGTVVHVLLFHLLRLPLYWGRLVVRSPVGAGRLLLAWWRWTSDEPGRHVHQVITATVVGTRAAHVPGRRVGLGGGSTRLTRTALAERASDPAAGVTTRLDAETFLRLSAHHRATVRSRTVASGAALIAGSLFGLGTFLTLPTGTQLAVTAVILPLLGLAGRAADRPVTSRATDSAAVPRLTSDLILTALGSLGIGELNKGLTRGDGVRFPGPITRDGPGWRADVDLPPGVTAGDVIERRDRLASGLRRPLGCVWPEVDPDVHAGRLVLWVGDRPLAAGKPVAWPLTKTGRTNIFEPVPLGIDQRGRPVTVTLMFASGVVGAIPRMGKTFVMRLLTLAGALDPRVEVHAYNLKGGSDFDPLAAISHAYRTGDDEEDIAYLLRDLRALAVDRRRRYKVLRSLPRDVCPESKVTDELAGRRDLGLHPVLLVIDECQLAFEHPVHGEELTALVTDLVKAGPAVGIMAWCATQRPDAKSLPRDISANAVLRLALKVTGQLENDMILGTSAYKNGVRATMLSRRDRGVAILAGEHDDPRVVRIAYVNSPTAENIAARARTARKLADLLTGHAAGVEADTDTDSTGVLDHLIEVWPTGVGRVWCDELSTALATAWPGRYDGWTGEQVTTAVKPHGVTTVQVKRTTLGRQTNRRGLDLNDVRDAHERHRGPGTAPQSGTDDNAGSAPERDDTTG